MADIETIKADLVKKAAGLSEDEVQTVRKRLIQAADLIENGEFETVIKDFSDNPFLTGVLPREVLESHDRVHDQHDRINDI